MICSGSEHHVLGLQSIRLIDNVRINSYEKPCLTETSGGLDPTVHRLIGWPSSKPCVEGPVSASYCHLRHSVCELRVELVESKCQHIHQWNLGRQRKGIGILILRDVVAT